MNMSFLKILLDPTFILSMRKLINAVLHLIYLMGKLDQDLTPKT